MIPEIGMVGNAYRKDLFSLTFDRGNPNFRASLANEVLRRQIAHEVHHCARYENPGYGSSLKEAIVSEGLAGLFVKEIFGNPPRTLGVRRKARRCSQFFQRSSSRGIL